MNHFHLFRTGAPRGSGICDGINDTDENFAFLNSLISNHRSPPAFPSLVCSSLPIPGFTLGCFIVGRGAIGVLRYRYDSALRRKWSILHRMIKRVVIATLGERKMSDASKVYEEHGSD